MQWKCMIKSVLHDNFLENVNDINYFKKKLYFIAYLHSNYALHLISNNNLNKFIKYSQNVKRYAYL